MRAVKFPKEGYLYRRDKRDSFRKREKFRGFYLKIRWKIIRSYINRLNKTGRASI